MRKRKGRKFYKSKVGKGEVMVNRTAARLHTAWAPHYYTKLGYGYQGAIWNAAPTPSQQWEVLGSSLASPGNTAFPFTTANGTPGVLYPATLSLATLGVAGVSELSVLYNKFRVYASRISVTVTPNAALGLEVGMVVWPSGAGSTVTDFQRAISLPYSKFIMCTPQNNVRENTLQVYMDAPTVLGLTKQQYQNDLDTSGVPGSPGSNPSLYFTWNVIVYVNNGTNLPLTQATAVSVQLHVDYYAEFFAPLPPTDT